MCFAPQWRAILNFSYGPVALASLLFDHPEPQNIGKTQCFPAWLLFLAEIFFILIRSFLIFPLLDFFSFLALLATVASSVHKSEVWLPNFLPYSLLMIPQNVLPHSFLRLPRWWIRPTACQHLVCKALSGHSATVLHSAMECSSIDTQPGGRAFAE